MPRVEERRDGVYEIHHDKIIPLLWSRWHAGSFGAGAFPAAFRATLKRISELERRGGP